MHQYCTLCLDFEFCSCQIKWNKSSISYSNCKLCVFEINTACEERLWSRIFKISKLAKRITAAFFFSKLLLTVFWYTKQQIWKDKSRSQERSCKPPWVRTVFFCIYPCKQHGIWSHSVKAKLFPRIASMIPNLL